MVSERKSKILVVNDEAFNILVIKGLMRELGIKDIEKRVDCCYNGEQLVESVQKAVDEDDPYRYSLILTDCMMPYIDGYEAIKRVRTILQPYQEKYLYVVAVTGHVERECIHKAESCGMDTVYPKPLPILELGLRLRDLQFIEDLPSHVKKDDT